jgi:hypothetical protein
MAKTSHGGGHGETEYIEAGSLTDVYMLRFWVGARRMRMKKENQ